MSISCHLVISSLRGRGGTCYLASDVPEEGRASLPCHACPQSSQITQPTAAQRLLPAGHNRPRRGSARLHESRAASATTMPNEHPPATAARENSCATELCIFSGMRAENAI